MEVKERGGGSGSRARAHLVDGDGVRVSDDGPDRVDSGRVRKVDSEDEGGGDDAPGAEVRARLDEGEARVAVGAAGAVVDADLAGFYGVAGEDG